MHQIFFRITCLAVFLISIQTSTIGAQSPQLGLTQELIANPDMLAKIGPDVLAGLQAGDPAAAYDAAIALLPTWQEPYLRAAIPLLERAFEGGNLNHNNLWLAAISARMLGTVHVGLSEYTQGLAYSEQAEAIARSLTDLDVRTLVAATMEDQTRALNGLSRYRDALVILDHLLAFYRTDPVDELAIANINWTKGISHEGLGEFDEAAAAYYAAMEYFAAHSATPKVELAALGNNMGWVMHRKGRYAEAEEWFTQILPYYVESLGPYAENTSKNYINLGLSVFELGRPDEAITWAMKAMPYIASNPRQSLADQRWNFELLARAFAAKGNITRAIFFGKLAVNAQQAIRAANTTGKKDDNQELRAEWRRLYQLLADLLITQGRISEAQAVLNMEKEEEVYNFLKRDGAADLTKTRAVLNNTELSEEDRLATLAAMPIAADAELRALTVKLDGGTATEAEEDQMFLLQDALQKQSDAFDAAVADFLSQTDETARATLKGQFDATGSYQADLAKLTRPTAILQIATLPDAVHLFVTLPNLTFYEKIDVSRADLAKLAFDALQAIETQSPDARDKLQALHTVLFAPIQQKLIDSGTEVVMLNLDSFLRYLPFAALYDGQGYLVERFAFAQYTPAVKTDFQTPDRTGPKTAGFGVTEGHPGFSPLPGVKRELETIFGASEGQGVLTGPTALDAGFDERSLRRSLLKRPAILHIASHFNLVPGAEDDSFLLLGDGAHLALSKIRSNNALSFKGIDLLTLSACQTARGSDGDGAEIDGFGATAQLNGASAVMASLWPVSDAATPRLMRDFYAGIMQGGLDKAEALRQAQIKMLHSTEIGLANAGGEPASNRAAAALDSPAATAKVGFDHPYFWSAFVLMGNWL